MSAVSMVVSAVSMVVSAVSMVVSIVTRYTHGIVTHTVHSVHTQSITGRDTCACKVPCHESNGCSAVQFKLLRVLWSLMATGW